MHLLECYVFINCSRLVWFAIHCKFLLEDTLFVLLHYQMIHNEEARTNDESYKRGPLEHGRN